MIIFEVRHSQVIYFSNDMGVVQSGIQKARQKNATIPKCFYNTDQEIMSAGRYLYQEIASAFKEIHDINSIRGQTKKNPNPSSKITFTQMKKAFNSKFHISFAF